MLAYGYGPGDREYICNLTHIALCYIQHSNCPAHAGAPCAENTPFLVFWRDGGGGGGRRFDDATSKLVTPQRNMKISRPASPHFSPCDRRTGSVNVF